MIYLTVMMILVPVIALLVAGGVEGRNPFKKKERLGLAGTVIKNEKKEIVGVTTYVYNKEKKKVEEKK